MRQGIDVLYMEGACLVVNKPPGILTQAPPGIDSMEELVRQYWQATSGRSHRLYVGVPHRLDRPASGVLIFTRNRRAAHRMAQQFASRQVDKYYLAWVAGTLAEPAGTWHDYLCKDPQQAQVQIVAANEPRAMPATLSFQVLATFPGESLVAVTLVTGRTHQIRVQFASRHHPLLGDVQYGSRVSFGPDATEPRQRAIALHARRVRFRHPTLPHFVTVTAPVPSLWCDRIRDIEPWIFERENQATSSQDDGGSAPSPAGESS